MSMADTHQLSLFAELELPPPPPLPEGAHYLHGFLTRAEQREFAAACLDLGAGQGGFYRPKTGNLAGKLDFQMYCMGKHNVNHGYSTRRLGVDGVKVLPLPPSFAALASRAADSVGMQIQADIAIVNWYEAHRGLGMHQDGDESAETIAKGIPVISVSLGDDASFTFSKTKERVSGSCWFFRLQSGDAFIFGGPSRLGFHEIGRVYRGTGPKDLGFKGRINITFRQY